jgi:hypothetical protein
MPDTDSAKVDVMAPNEPHVNPEPGRDSLWLHGFSSSSVSFSMPTSDPLDDDRFLNAFCTKPASSLCYRARLNGGGIQKKKNLLSQGTGFASLAITEGRGRRSGPRSPQE